MEEREEARRAFYFLSPHFAECGGALGEDVVCFSARYI